MLKVCNDLFSVLFCVPFMKWINCLQKNALAELLRWLAAGIELMDRVNERKLKCHHDIFKEKNMKWELTCINGSIVSKFDVSVLLLIYEEKLLDSSSYRCQALFWRSWRQAWIDLISSITSSQIATLFSISWFKLRIYWI